MNRIKKSQVDRLHDAELKLAQARTAAKRDRFQDPSIQGVLILLTEGLHEMSKVLVEAVAPKGYFAEEPK